MALATEESHSAFMAERGKSMSSQLYDVAVLGLGVMGSAVAYELSRHGRRVVGIEQSHQDDNRGSSYGQSRIIRKGYFEHPDYVPLVLRSYELWHGVEELSGKRLIIRTGGVMVGTPESPMVRGTLSIANQHQLRQRTFSYDEIKRLYPQMIFRPDEIAIYEEDTGVLLAEECVRAFRSLALDHGADLRFGTKANININSALSAREEIAIEADGERVIANQLVIAAGPWTSRILGDSCRLGLKVERIPTYWFNPVSHHEYFEPQRFPVFMWDYAGEPFCIFPKLDDKGVKVAFHHSQDFVEPDSIDRNISEHEVAKIRSRLDAAAPSLNGQLQGATVCMYTNTPDGNFAIGMIEDSNVLLLSPCSGHGFKFAPVIAEIVGDLLIRGSTNHDINLFRLDRSSLLNQSILRKG
jgi:sarcosine oxidase